MGDPLVAATAAAPAVVPSPASAAAPSPASAAAPSPAPAAAPSPAAASLAGASATVARPLWRQGDAGVMRLPSGRLVRGRGMRDPMPSGHPPTFGVYLLGAEPPELGWPSRWVRWPDFRLPADPAHAARALHEALERAADGRVEIACWGGRGRTGTALACLAVLDGVPPDEAVAFVRAHYHPRAVETPWQRRYVRTFRPEKARQ